MNVLVVILTMLLCFITDNASYILIEREDYGTSLSGVKYVNRVVRS